MKILFVATVMSHLKAFHEPYMEWLQEQGFEVHAAANGDADLCFCDKKHPLPVERSPFRVQNAYAFFVLKKIMDEEHYDIIHCHTPMGGVLARLAAMDARKRGTRVIYTAHGFHFYKGASVASWLIYYPIEFMLSAVTDVLITINREDYQRAKKFPAKKVVYVPGVGIDTEKFRVNERYRIAEHLDSLQAEATRKDVISHCENEQIALEKNRRKELRREFGVKDDDILLLSVGELNENKNHVVIVEALAALHDPHIKYVICGEGSNRTALKEKAKSLKLEHQVILAGYRQDMAAIYAAADIFVFPSKREGLPVALMEAMASGLPVVASRIRGNTDLICHKHNGYLVQATKVESYQTAIRVLSDNPRKRMRFGQAAQESVQKYSLQKVKKRMAKIYNGLARKPMTF